jgi:hypothetical protein
MGVRREILRLRNRGRAREYIGMISKREVVVDNGDTSERMATIGQSKMSQKKKRIRKMTMRKRRWMGGRSSWTTCLVNVIRERCSPCEYNHDLLLVLTLVDAVGIRKLIL